MLPNFDMPRTQAPNRPLPLSHPVKASFTEQENALLQEYLSEKGKASEEIREIRAYSPPTTYFRMRHESFQLLCPEGWLNDNVIDFLLSLL
jgi:hypothetical protein